MLVDREQICCADRLSSPQWRLPMTEHADRTSFAPETTSPKRDKDDRAKTKKQQNQQARPLTCRSAAG
jgi:hypothetical protein